MPQQPPRRKTPSRPAEPPPCLRRLTRLRARRVLLAAQARLHARIVPARAMADRGRPPHRCERRRRPHHPLPRHPPHHGAAALGLPAGRADHLVRLLDLLVRLHVVVRLWRPCGRSSSSSRRRQPWWRRQQRQQQQRQHRRRQQRPWRGGRVRARDGACRRCVPDAPDAAAHGNHLDHRRGARHPQHAAAVRAGQPLQAAGLPVGRDAADTAGAVAAALDAAPAAVAPLAPRHRLRLAAS